MKIIYQQNALLKKVLTGLQFNKCNIKFFHRPRHKELYSPPHLLIRKIIGKEGLISEFVKEYLTFVSDIFAVHAPLKAKKELKALSKYISSNGKLLRFYILATSSRVKIIKATSLYDEDILNIPYPYNLSDAQLSKAEKLLIKDSLNYFLSSDSQKVFEDAKEDDVMEFSKIFSETLNSIYQVNNKTFHLFKILETSKYFAMHFEYTNTELEPKKEVLENLEHYVQEIIPTKKDNSEGIHIQRVLKLYGRDRIILAKPKQLRYWIPSIALRDADETFADYLKARYQNAQR